MSVSHAFLLFFSPSLLLLSLFLPFSEFQKARPILPKAEEWADTGRSSGKPQPGAITATRHLTLTASTSAAAVSPGAQFTLFLDVVPKPRMHVYAREQKDVVSVSLHLQPNPNIRPGRIRFPPSQKYFFEPLNETQRVYRTAFRIAQDVSLAQTLLPPYGGPGATLTITGTFRYQACDDTICYLPQNVPMSWSIVTIQSGS